MAVIIINTPAASPAIVGNDSPVSGRVVIGVGVWVKVNELPDVGVIVFVGVGVLVEVGVTFPPTPEDTVAVGEGVGVGEGTGPPNPPVPVAVGVGIGVRVGVGLSAPRTVREAGVVLTNTFFPSSATAPTMEFCPKLITTDPTALALKK